MEAYIFQAALLCEACALAVKEDTKPPMGVDPDNPDECLYDSDDYPKGPYPDGGGEADCPQHCDHCHKFLENPLTGDGYAYVREALAPFTVAGDVALYEDGDNAYARTLVSRIKDEAQRLRMPDLLGDGERNTRQGDVLESVTAVWADYYPEAWDHGNGGPIGAKTEESCTYPRCKCIVSTSTSQPEPVCPKGKVPA